MSLVRPTLEYASVVRDPYQQNDIHRLDMVQRRAARYVTNRYHNTSSVTDMINQLEWPSLQERRQHSRLLMLYKNEQQFSEGRHIREINTQQKAI